MYKILNESIKSCEAYSSGKYPTRRTACIYPFTTENISGYIGEFDLKNKSLLTVGSSGDQVINAALYNCKDITLLDMVPDTKYYYYLKVAALLSLSRDEFIVFFSSYPSRNSFNVESYKKLRDTLRGLDSESFKYFDALFNRFPGQVIRKSIFQNDEHRPEIVIKTNPYLSSNISFDETKEKIKNVETKFLCQNIFNVDVNQTYNNIWLSNIATWQTFMTDITSLFTSIYPLLNEDGKLLLSYLYNAGIASSFSGDRPPIYNVEEVKKVLRDYSIVQTEFESVMNTEKDSVLVLTKKTNVN